MNAIEQIELYNNLYYVFAGIAAVSLALAIFFFFRFDIPGVYAVMTGKQRKRTIQQMEERNHETGKLRFQYPATGGATTGKRSRTEKNAHTGRGAKAKTGTVTHAPPRAAERPAPNPPQRTTTAAPAPRTMERPDTEVLTGAAPETMILQEKTGHTEELDRTMVLKPNQLDFDFRVTQSTVEIHTDELI